MNRLTVQIEKLQSRRWATALRLTTGALVLLCPVAGQAAHGTWMGNESGNWTDSTKWYVGAVANGAGFTLTGESIAKAGVTRTITLNEPHTIGSLAMTANGRTYQFSGSGTITLDNGGSVALVRCVSGGSIIIDVPIAGNIAAGMRTPNQTGAAVFNAANTFSGHVFIHRGRLKLGNIDALPYGSRTGKIELETGGNLGDTPRLDLADFDITINGLSSNTNNSSAGTLPQVTTSSANAGTSILTLGDNDASATYEGTVDDGAVRQVAVTKIGSGTQSLRGNNAYTGNTTVNAGHLAIDGTVSSPVTVNGGMLGGVGHVYNSVTVSAGGSISAGSGTGVLTLYNGLDLSAGGTNVWELAANSDSNPGSDFDQIVLAGGYLDVTNGTLVLKFSGSANANDPFWLSEHSWTVIAMAGGVNPTFSNFKKVVNATPAPGSFMTTTDEGGNIVLSYVTCCGLNALRITSVGGAGTGSVTVNYTNSIPGTNYVLQYNTNLNSGTWNSVITNAAGGHSASQTDDTAAGDQRFYRISYPYVP